MDVVDRGQLHDMGDARSSPLLSLWGFLSRLNEREERGIG